tara:strand:- start:74 stop:1441 length:1368 start_codon:yes stop_codon:yes gene_type:complete
MGKYNKKKSLKNINKFFEEKNFYKSYLFIEKEFSLTLGELNIIPKNSALEISQKCNINLFNFNQIQKEIKKTSAPIATLANFIAKKCTKENRKFVHYGATTHNIMHAGIVLILRNSHIQSMYRISDCLKILSDLSSKYSNTPMIARTNGQHSMPITFGFKVSGWAELILRLEERFTEIEKRLFILIFGGAVGAMHSFRGKGELIYKNLCKRLNLKKVLIQSRSMVDNIAEYILLCSHFGSIVKNIGNELSFHMREEIKEIAEKQNKTIIGSSTMPQKVNPKYVYKLITLGKEMESNFLKGVNILETQNEGDLGSQNYIVDIIKDIFPKFNLMLEEFNNLLKNLVIKKEKMNDNISLTQDLIYSENVTMYLAPIIGKNQAYEVVSKIIKQVRSEKSSFRKLLSLNIHLKNKDINKLLDIKKNIGNSAKMAKKLSKISKIRSINLRNRIKKIPQVFH